MTTPNENGQGDSALRECVREIVQDWREYLIGVGSCFPPNEDEYRTMFAKMTANLEEAKSLIE